MSLFFSSHPLEVLVCSLSWIFSNCHRLKLFTGSIVNHKEGKYQAKNPILQFSHQKKSFAVWLCKCPSKYSSIPVTIAFSVNVKLSLSLTHFLPVEKNVGDNLFYIRANFILNHQNTGKFEEKNAWCQQMSDNSFLSLVLFIIPNYTRIAASFLDFYPLVLENLQQQYSSSVAKLKLFC